jgi:hypothetical protein
LSRLGLNVLGGLWFCVSAFAGSPPVYFTTWTRGFSPENKIVFETSSNIQHLYATRRGSNELLIGQRVPRPDIHPGYGLDGLALPESHYFEVRLSDLNTPSRVDLLVHGEDPIAGIWYNPGSSFVSVDYRFLSVERGWQISRKYVGQENYSDSLYFYGQEPYIRMEESGLRSDLGARNKFYLWNQLHSRRQKVYLSLSTSPSRIAHLPEVLNRLDLEWVEKIFLNLPVRHSRDPRPYVIPPELLKNPKIEIVRVENDLGPITKLLPAVSLLKQRDPGAWLITIDDDIYYSPEALRELIVAKLQWPKAVISGSGIAWHQSGIENRDTVANDYENPYKTPAATPVDLIEGFAGILYSVQDLDVDTLSSYSQLSLETRLSDDLVISYYLMEKKIPRIRFSTRYGGVETLRSAEWGLNEEALHRGAGFCNPGEDNCHYRKYRVAFEQLQNRGLPCFGNLVPGSRRPRGSRALRN